MLCMETSVVSGHICQSTNLDSCKNALEKRFLGVCEITQPASASSKLTIETLEQVVKHVQS